MCDAGQASIGYLYFDFWDTDKQHWRNLVLLLLTQLSTYSVPCFNILSCLHSDHKNGMQQPSDDSLTQCLKNMLTLPDQHPIYLIIDAHDECSNVSGIPSHRNRVLQLVKEFIDLYLPDLHICITSRPEVDIWEVLEPLTSRRVIPSYLSQRYQVVGQVLSQLSTLLLLLAYWPIMQKVQNQSFD
jgi:hypothetical protein